MAQGSPSCRQDRKGIEFGRKRDLERLTDSKNSARRYAELEGPFTLGEVARGVTTYPGYEGMRWEANIVALERERLFAFEWCPYEHDDCRDYASAPKLASSFG